MRGSEIYMYIYIVKDIEREREKERDNECVCTFCVQHLISLDFIKTFGSQTYIVHSKYTNKKHQLEYISYLAEYSTIQ